MSRSGYTDALDSVEVALYRGRVANAFKGKRSQRFLHELAAALDAMPEKILVASEEGEIVDAEGSCCTLGAVALARGWDDSQEVDSTDHEVLAARLDIAECVVREIECENDETWRAETPAQRWVRMRRWVERQIKREAPPC